VGEEYNEIENFSFIFRGEKKRKRTLVLVCHKILRTLRRKELTPSDILMEYMNFLLTCF